MVLGCGLGDGLRSIVRTRVDEAYLQLLAQPADFLAAGALAAVLTAVFVAHHLLAMAMMRMMGYGLPAALN